MSRGETLALVHRLKRAGRFVEALDTLAPLAEEQRRRCADVLVAIEVTELESWLLGAVGDRDMALTRATWILGVAHEPRHAERLATPDGARLLFLGYRRWVLSALKNERVDPAQVWTVIDELEALLRRVGRERWMWTVSELRADVHEGLGQKEQAAVALFEAIEGFHRGRGGPGSTLASLRRSLAWTLSDLERHDEAIAQLMLVVEDPDTAAFDRFGAKVYLSQCFVQVQQWAEAARWADEATAESEGFAAPQQIAAYGTAVEAWLGVDRLEDAARGATRMRALAAQLGGAVNQYNAAQDSFDVALRMGRLDEAAGWFMEMQAQLQRIERRRPDALRQRLVEERRARLAEAQAAR
ncbi:MAG: hypothetical protein H6741_02170 [Alphaproteobacteria bacterium]|nr:hypothetical protein [Alphaproteobacteria bacterium]MCB9791509.1 hypothetical protein [Alphaproteobacteria bacterium]